MACTSYQSIQVGQYSNKNNKNTFTLFFDSTFEYKRTLVHGSRFVEKYSFGKWIRLDNNTLVLNSYIQDRIALIDAEVRPSKNNRT